MRKSLLVAGVLALGCNGGGSNTSGFDSGTEGMPSTGSSTGTNPTGATGTTTVGSDSTGTTGRDAPIFDLGAGTGTIDLCGEPEDNPIYLLTRGLETGEATSIQAFDPPTLTFSPAVAAIQCEGTEDDWGVSSMAVDRQRGAWITWSALHDGPDDPAYKRLDRIDLDTGACETDVAALPTTEQWGSPLGMAYVSDGADSGNETLYFVDTGTYLHTIGSKSSPGRWWTLGPEGRTFSGVELTGSGDGRMFSLIMNYTGPFDFECTAEMPCPPTVRLAEVDRAGPSAISMLDLTEIEAFGIDPGGFAFAHWGGHIWVFISRDFGATEVFDHDPETQTTTRVVDDGAPGVVGAGVSTCAPLVLPEG
ncbi:MAG: hypothetical protein ACE37F_15505 [Nannocystaceae bacterium]|nr:hypothetical protein [bacterium]